MLCENCRENDAVVNLTTIKDNVVAQQHLCEKCAAAKGVETSVSPKHPLLGEILEAVHQKASLGGGDDARACHFCGATTRDFRATGRLGCARCYTAFERHLRELLRKLHGNSRHIGRAYEAPAAEMVERAGSVAQLRDRLRRAIDSEQFELAAELRDRLRSVDT
jgi:protein arginine kinase activator